MARASKYDLIQYIRCSTPVRHVTYDNDVYTVEAIDLANGATSTRQFTHVIVATGHFSYPNVPTCVID